MLSIKLENLSEGMILKNYKELCKVLEVDEKRGGNSRESQVNWFKEHFNFEKEGHKFIITDIFATEVKPEPTRGGAYNKVEYINNIEKLILDILVQNKKGEIFLSKNKLFYALEMVNVNYLDTKQRTTKLSKYLDIKEENVEEWFDTTGGMLERNLESALKSLRNQALVFWSKEITICIIEPIADSEVLVPKKHINKYGEEVIEYIMESKTKRVIREATDEEKKFILEVERNTMEKLDCENKQEVIRKGVWSEFETSVKTQLKEKYNIIYYFQSYKIIFNPNHIEKKWKKVNFLLDGKERQDQKAILNQSIIARLEDNTNSRQINALNELESSDVQAYQPDRIIRRSSDTYIHDSDKLNKTLIDKKAKDIRSDVGKIKLE